MSMKSYSSSSPPENLPSERERAIDELVQGRHFAYQLKAFLLQNQNQNQSVLVPPPAQDLVLNVLNSFTNTLSILNNNPPHHSDGDHPLSSSSDLRKSDDSGDSSRSSSSTKYPRGCYKRRKTSHSWTRDSPDLVDDGNAWRKYGQKQILNAKYPRNYYRCTHKHEQGCEAKKQVQRIEEDPPLYRTIYSGNHTCNNLLKANHLYIDYHDSDHANDSSVLLSFNNNEHDQNHPFFATSMKQEDHIHTRNNNEINQPTTTSSSSGYILSGADHDHAAMVINNSSSCTTVADDDHYSFHVEHLMMDDPPQFDEDGLFGVII